MKKVWIIFILLCGYGLCIAQPIPRWGRLSTDIAVACIEGLTFGYLFNYCQYPSTVDDLLIEAEIVTASEPKDDRKTWEEIVGILRRDRDHLSMKVDNGISYYQSYVDPTDSLEHRIPVEGPVFYLFYDNDTLLHMPVDDYPGPCELVSDIEIYPMEYFSHSRRFEGPRFYNDSGKIVYTSQKKDENFAKKIQSLEKAYLFPTGDPKIPYPSYYYVYNGMWGCNIKCPIYRYVEYRDNELHDYCTGDVISHESLYNEKVTKYLRKYAKRHKYSMIRYMTTHFNPEGKNVEVKKEDFNKVIWKRN